MTWHIWQWELSISWQYKEFQQDSFQGMDNEFQKLCHLTIKISFPSTAATAADVIEPAPKAPPVMQSKQAKDPVND